VAQIGTSDRRGSARLIVIIDMLMMSEGPFLEAVCRDCDWRNIHQIIFLCSFSVRMTRGDRFSGLRGNNKLKAKEHIHNLYDAYNQTQRHD
jgi:hypothetical protein